MEEVTGSIPVRSTNQSNELAPPAFLSLVVFLTPAKVSLGSLNGYHGKPISVS
jgi:hypothetical protein